MTSLATTYSISPPLNYKILSSTSSIPTTYFFFGWVLIFVLSWFEFSAPPLHHTAAGRKVNLGRNTFPKLWTRAYRRIKAGNTVSISACHRVCTSSKLQIIHGETCINWRWCTVLQFRLQRHTTYHFKMASLGIWIWCCLHSREREREREFSSDQPLCCKTCSRFLHDNPNSSGFFKKKRKERTKDVASSPVAKIRQETNLHLVIERTR